MEEVHGERKLGFKRLKLCIPGEDEGNGDNGRGKMHNGEEKGWLMRQEERRRSPLGLHLDVDDTLIQMIRNELGRQQRHDHAVDTTAPTTSLSSGKKPKWGSWSSDREHSHNQEVPVREESLEPDEMDVREGELDSDAVPVRSMSPSSYGAAATGGGTGGGNDGIGIRSTATTTTTTTTTTPTPPGSKLKASNWPAVRMKIGSWIKESRYEGDLLAKAYYAKKKLVWEVLEAGVKSKIEIPWADIVSLRVEVPDKEVGRIHLRVARAPSFFREDEPQPRKHTTWLSTVDFTGGQASRCRRHTLEFPAGVLNRHYRKLLDCDERLRKMTEEEDGETDGSEHERDSAASDNDKMGHSDDDDIENEDAFMPSVTPFLMAKNRTTDGSNGDFVVPGSALRTHVVVGRRKRASEHDAARRGGDRTDIWRERDAVDDSEADKMVSMFLCDPAAAEN